MNNKVIITCAVTGGIHTPTLSEALPYTPSDIAHQATFTRAIPRPVPRPATLTSTGDPCRSSARRPTRLST